MRIIAGELKGRSFDQPKTRSVRPLSEKVRAALFDIVGNLEEFVVLDAYAGSGAAGFEAMSRGAVAVEAIESKSRVAGIIDRNAHQLGFGPNYRLRHMTVETWLSTNQAQNYDLIIADPPYELLEANILNRLARYLKPDGVLAVSHSSKMSSPMLESMELVRHKIYGDSALSFYQLKS